MTIVLKKVNAGYQGRGRLLGGLEPTATVLHEVDLTIKEGGFLGIIGESGSGKTTLARLLCGLIKPSSGEVVYSDSFLEKERRFGKKLKRGSVAIVFQDYLSSVNPKMKIEAILAEPQTLRAVSASDYQEEVEETLKLLGIEASVLQRYPHEVSGGQLQRICIARAVLLRPQIILFDEVTSALDSVTQLQILDLIKKIHKAYRMTCIFITHDILAATYCCEQMIIMQKGRVVDQVNTLSELGQVKDPYSRKLLGAVGSLEAFGHDRDL